MGSYYKEKLPELLTHLAAEFVERESNRNSLITVTRTILGKNERSAKIFFSVLPETDEVKVLSFLNRKRGEFAEYVDKHARIGMMPGIEFVIDSGEKNRQKIEGIPLDK